MVWDTTAPLNDGSDIETENDKIHDNWAALETTLDVDHYGVSDPVSTSDGEHRQVTLNELGSKPDVNGRRGFLYTKNDDTNTELFYEDASANEIQITKEGALYGNSLVPVAWMFVEADGTGHGKNLVASVVSTRVRHFTFSGYTPQDANYAVITATTGDEAISYSYEKTTAGFNVANRNENVELNLVVYSNPLI